MVTKFTTLEGSPPIFASTSGNWCCLLHEGEGGEMCILGHDTISKIIEGIELLLHRAERKQVGGAKHREYEFVLGLADPLRGLDWAPCGEQIDRIILRWGEAFDGGTAFSQIVEIKELKTWITTLRSMIV